ncbi:MAG: DNRLRE domain-containing protein [Saprospiraceae bacterium]
MKNLLVLSLLCVTTIIFAQSTIILQPDAATGKDARIFNLDALGNFGSDPDLIASQLVYTGGEPGTTRSLIEFDLTSLPKGANVINATLSLYYNSTSGTPGHLGTNATYLRRLIQPWDENTVAWNQQPFYSTDDEVLIPQSSQPDQDYENIDVTAIVKYSVDHPNTSYGFMMMLQVEEGMGSMKFYSSDGSNIDEHPRLVITYGSVANKEIRPDEIFVHPNPFSNSISINDLTGVYFMTITDVNGKTFMQKEIELDVTDHQINGLEALPPGSYFLNLTGKDKNYFGRIVKAGE